MLTANNSSMLGRDINPSRLTASLCSAAVVTMYKRRAGQTSGFHRASCQLSAVTQERNRCSTGNWQERVQGTRLGGSWGDDMDS